MHVTDNDFEMNSFLNENYHMKIEALNWKEREQHGSTRHLQDLTKG